MTAKYFFKGFKEGFHEFGTGVASIVNFFLLLIVFIIGIGPVSIISKLVGKKHLNMRSKLKSTYWQDHEQCSQSIEQYYRQF